MLDHDGHSIRPIRRTYPAPAPFSPDVRLDGPAWLTVSQLCRRWQLGRKTVYKFINAEILPVWRLSGRLHRVAVEDVLRFETRNMRPPR